MSDVLVVESVSKNFGGIAALKHVAMTLRPGEVHALIGPNGAGKTTLVSVLCGEIAACEGRITMAGTDVGGMSVHARARLGLARTYQLTNLFNGLSVRDNLLLSLLAREGAALRPVQFFHDRRSRRLAQDADAILERFGLTALGNNPPAVLSHGDKRRLELAMATSLEPKILLLDEPLAGLSGTDAKLLIRTIAEELKGKIPILLIEHDMDAVFELADRVTVLVDGTVLVTDTPAAVRASREVQEAYLSEDEDV